MNVMTDKFDAVDGADRNEQFDAVMLELITKARRRKRAAETARDRELAAIAAQRRALDEREQTAVATAQAEIAAEERRITKARAYIAAGN